MAYFTNSQGYLFLCSDIPFEEKQKLDDYLLYFGRIRSRQCNELSVKLHISEVESYA